MVGNPVVPCPSRYGADATLGHVGHSVALSRRPAKIAGVVEGLMRHDELLGGSAEAGGQRTADEPASSDTENEASCEAEIRFLAEASRETPRAIRRIYPYRGLPWIASGETETAPPAEARRPLPRPTLGSLARGGVCFETSCSRRGGGGPSGLGRGR